MILFELLFLFTVLISTLNGLERPAVGISPQYPKEGGNVTLTCNGNLSHSNVTYHWFNNDIHLDNEKQVLVLVADRHKTGPYSCKVNSTKSDPKYINVLYPLAAPTSVQLQSTPQSISLSWLPPSYSKSFLKPLHYYIYLKEVGSSPDDGAFTLISRLVDDTQFNVTALHPARDYQLQVSAVNRYGEGANATAILGRTKDGISMKVRDFHAIGGLSQKIKVTWKKPNVTNGDITYYQVCSIKTLNDLGEIDPNPERKCTDTQNLTFMFVNLGKYSTYNIEVSAVNRAGPGQVSTVRNVLTSEEAPDAVHGELANRSHYSILMKWSTPPHVYGKLRGYNVSYSADGKDFHAACVYTKELFCDIDHLQPSTQYTIEITVINGLFKIPKRYKLWTLNVSAPLQYVGTLPLPESIDEHLIGVKLISFQGAVKFYDVIVTELGSEGRLPRHKPNSYSTQSIMNGKDGLYVAGRLFDSSKWNKLFVVGETLNSSDMKNVSSLPIVQVLRLKENTYYGLFVRGYADSHIYQSTSWYAAVKTKGGAAVTSPLSGGTITLIVIVIIVIIALIIALTYVYRTKQIPLPIGKGPAGLGVGEKRRESLNKHTNFIGGENDPRVPIPIDSFQEHVYQLNANSRYSFSRQYMMIGRELDQSYDVSRHQENNLKNRYHNVPAYDETRVHLEIVDNDLHSDYINGNHIDGFELPKEYIATQGPLPETVFDFWRMVWEYDSSTIVMLTKLQEKGRLKCAQYWPASSNAIIVKDIVITLTEVQEFPDHVVRTFHVTRTAQAVEKVVRQYHFIAWPDFGVPEDPSGLLCFMKKVNNWKTSQAPLIIHCSAGVGRTGTYITIDTQIKNMRKNKEIAIFSNVSDLRSQRCLMVQTEDQYVFIHHALLAFLESDDTEVDASDLNEYVNLKAQVDNKSGMSGFFEEFIRLAKADQSDQFTESVRPVNIAKNRYKNICPYDSTRVCLLPYPGLEGSDYINANFIDSYMYKDNFIATQAPLESTACDFWRMVWEQSSEIIVMLVKETDPGMANIYSYFPHEKGASMKIRYFIIELGHETTYGDYIQREIKITNTEASSSKRIYHFQYSTWPEGGQPDNGLGLVELIGQVRRLNDSISNHPIVIHCSGGVGRTGVFIALSNLIERVKAENVVDVYQTVKKMRLQRTAMVQTKDQYEFCYHVVQEFLASFDLYANDNFSSKDSFDSSEFVS